MRGQNRHSGEFRGRAPAPVNTNGPSPGVQVPSSRYGNGQARNPGMATGGPSHFDMARSPPNPSSKNTKHVPCKFFKQGACQAGRACPFSHAQDAAVESAPCKFFMKGNCKFGHKCLLEHIRPDGTRVDKSDLASRNGQLNFGGRMNPPMYHHQDSNITNAMMLQQHMENTYGPMPGFSPQDGPGSAQMQNYPYENLPGFDSSIASNPDSNFGSPLDESRFTMSPHRRHGSVLDVPLPQSFESNGVSNYARYGHIAASMPEKLSPPQLPQAQPGQPPEAPKVLQDRIYDSSTKSPRFLGSSPSNGLADSSDQTIGGRIMHSQKPVRSRILSSSVPRSRGADDWDDSFTLEEDLVPTNLHDEVLTPQEKVRRFSRPEHDLNTKDFPGALGIPSTSSSKVGSPGTAGSPSRFSELFAKQRRKGAEEGIGLSSSPYGVVGSPLRESSSLANRPTNSVPYPVSRIASAEAMPSISSPPKTSSVSLLASEFARQNLNRHDPRDSGIGLALGSTRHVSAPISVKQSHRNISSPGLTTTRIEEESGDGIFSMEEEESSKRSSMAYIGPKSPEREALAQTTNTGLPPGPRNGRDMFQNIKNIHFGET